MASRAWTGGSPLGEQRYRPVQPLWGMLAPGYNLHRDPFQLLANARFDIRDVWRERFPFTFWPLGTTTRSASCNSAECLEPLNPL